MKKVSKHENLYEDSARMYNKCMKESKKGEIKVKIEIENHRPHVWIVLTGIFPEADISLIKWANVVRYWLYRSQNHTNIHS